MKSNTIMGLIIAFAIFFLTIGMIFFALSSMGNYCIHLCTSDQETSCLESVTKPNEVLVGLYYDLDTNKTYYREIGALNFTEIQEVCNGIPIR